MVVRADSTFLSILLILANPTPRLPKLLPIAVEHARVGNDYTSFVRIYCAW